MTRSRRFESRRARGRYHQRRISDSQSYRSHRHSNPEFGLISSNCNHSTNMMGDVATNRRRSSMAVTCARDTRFGSHTGCLPVTGTLDNSLRPVNRSSNSTRTSSSSYRRRTCPSRRASVIARKRVRSTSISKTRRYSAKRRRNIRQRREKPSQTGSFSVLQNPVSGSGEHVESCSTNPSPDNLQEVNSNVCSTNEETEDVSKNVYCSTVGVNESITRHPFLLLSSQCKRSLPTLKSNFISQTSPRKQTTDQPLQRASWPTNSVSYYDSLNSTCPNITSNNMITGGNELSNNEDCAKERKLRESDNNIIDCAVVSGVEQGLNQLSHEFVNETAEMNNANVISEDDDPYFSSYSTTNDSFS
ncbi:unnamed protein product [Trichobilharzia regenti]|uniref:Uncharacterized protein n=1 Tax=Trichobilharzia regenti TaxID=157069 RepID=A0A183WGS6_TRIRE|nr:unnamed protein product [Trichobilharzia regenti]VDQ07209.1 unnamed protein product [Trichobilharzia regenti]